MLGVGLAVSTGTVHTAAATSRSGARHVTKNICYQDATSFNPHRSFNLPILWKEIYHPVKESHRVWSHSICNLFEFILLSVLGSNRGMDMLSNAVSLGTCLAPEAIYLSLPQFALHACEKDHVQKQLGEDGVYLAYQVIVHHQRNQSRN